MRELEKKRKVCDSQAKGSKERGEQVEGGSRDAASAKSRREARKRVESTKVMVKESEEVETRRVQSPM